MVVFNRCTRGNTASWKDYQVDLTVREEALRQVAHTIRWMLQRAQDDIRTQRARDDRLDAELRQLQAGHLYRTHDEVLSAIEGHQQVVARPRVTAREQYAAARVVEALKWVLEGPAMPTTTTFRRSGDSK
jgi:hypothetical protein